MRWSNSVQKSRIFSITGNLSFRFSSMIRFFIFTRIVDIGFKGKKSVFTGIFFLLVFKSSFQTLFRKNVKFSDFIFRNFIHKELNFDTALYYCSARKNRKFIFGIWNFRNWRYDGYDDAVSIGGNENDKKVCFIEAWNPVSRGWREFYIMSILDHVLEDRPLSPEKAVRYWQSHFC